MQTGPICHVRVLDANVVILSSYEAVYDVLVKQSIHTSSRPRSVMINDMYGCLNNVTLNNTYFELTRMGWGALTTFLNYGKVLRDHRTVMYKCLQPLAVNKYHSIQSETTHEMLGHILEAPDKFMHHIRRRVISMLMPVNDLLTPARPNCMKGNFGDYNGNGLRTSR